MKPHASRLLWRSHDLAGTPIRRHCLMLIVGLAAMIACTDDPVSVPNAVRRSAPHADAGPTAGPQLDAGANFMCGIRTDARVLCWGYAATGQTAVPTTVRATQVSAGEYHACAVESDGTV